MGEVAGDLDGLLDRAVPTCHMVDQGLRQRSFQYQDQSGVIDLQQRDRTTPGEDTKRVSLAEVARMRKRHLQHRGSGWVPHRHDQRNLAVRRLTLDRAVPAPTSGVYDARQLAQPITAGVTFAQRRDLCQIDWNPNHHQPP